MSGKHHYRAVYKSDHLGVADLEDMIEHGRELIFTIKQVKQEFGAKVAGKKGDFNIAYFAENIKPWVLNAHNSKILRKWTGSAMVEDWNDIAVMLYIDPNASFGGEKTGGVRINPNHRPQKQKPVITPESGERWDRAIASYKNNGNLNAVLQHADISPEHQQLITEQA